jgi:hypothetical protein
MTNRSRLPTARKSNYLKSIIDKTPDDFRRR